MGKYEFLKSESIVPIKKTIELKYEMGYGGEEKSVNVNVYPYTVKERTELQNMNKEAMKLLKDKDNEENQTKGAELIKDTANLAGYYVLKKDDSEITLDMVKKMPPGWSEDLMYAALEFEGVSKEQIDEKAKKVIDEIQQ